MSDEQSTTVTGVATAPAAEPKRTVIGQDSEAKLRERAAERGEEVMFYTLRGKEFRLLVPTPAPALLHAAQMGNDFGQIVEAIKACFHPDDSGKFMDELMRTDVEFPADTQYLMELINVIMEATSGRPQTS